MTDKKISIKWIEVILLMMILLVGLGLGTIAMSFIDGEREVRRPREEAFLRSAQLPLRQSELSTSQAELNTLRSKIMDQQVELVKQSAKLESLRVGYPPLTTKDLAAENSLKPETKAAFTQLQLDIDSTKRVLNDLNARLPTVSETAIQKAVELNAAQESVRREFEQAQKRFQLETRGLTFLASIAISVAVLLVASVFVFYLNRKGQFGIRAKFVLLCSFAILLALASYQAFQVAGAILTVVLIALLASIWALRSNQEGGTR